MSKVFDVEVSRQFDVVNKEWSEQIYLKLYLSMFTSGLVSELSPKLTVTLLAIASFMDNKGECYPTQEQIAERLGISRQTANQWINDLLKFRWNGKPLVTREKRRVKGSPNEFSIYTVLPVSHVAIFDSNVKKDDSPMSNSDDTPMSKNEDSLCQDSLTETRTNKQEPIKQDIEFKTAKDVILYFVKKYEETYGVKYSVNWSREGGMVKSKLLDVFSSKEIKDALDVLFEIYDERWSRPKFLRPTLGAFCSWAVNDCIAEAKSRQEEHKEMENVEEHGGQDVNDILAKLRARREKR